MADLVADQAEEHLISSLYDGKSVKSMNVDEAYEAEIFFPEMNGGGKWMIITAAPIPGPDGSIIGAVQTLQDITERRQAENEARENEQRYREMSITDSLTKLYN